MPSYNISEKAGSISVTVKRTGNLKQYAIVLCRTEQGTATSSSVSQPGKQDYVEYAGQVGSGYRFHYPRNNTRVESLYYCNRLRDDCRRTVAELWMQGAEPL